jgi:hypothetical protein
VTRPTHKRGVESQEIRIFHTTKKPFGFLNIENWYVTGQ